MKCNKLWKKFWILGIIIALIGAGIMFHGNVFGENNSGIATIIGIIGIGLIATSGSIGIGKIADSESKIRKKE